MTKQELIIKAKPVLFNTDEVRAILDGRKTQMRLPIKPQPGIVNKGFRHSFKKNEFKRTYTSEEFADKAIQNALYQIGDILYVREKYGYLPITKNSTAANFDTDFDNPTLYYAADDNPSLEGINVKWVPNIRMKKEAARIFLRVTDVRCERVQDMAGLEFILEGGKYNPPHPLYLAFKPLWDKKHAKKGFGWDANPWVFMFEFELVNL